VAERGADGGFQLFRRRVLKDPVLQARLRGQREWCAFCAVCCASATERGLELSSGELERARALASRPGLVGAKRPANQTALDSLDASAPAGFTPVEFDADLETVQWLDLRGIALMDPFFGDTVVRALSDPYRLLFTAVTAVDQLDTAAGDGRESLELAGFVFHTSRCGSTLICRMLAQVPGTVAFSEPAIVDQLLRAPGVENATRMRRLRSVVAALGQRLEPGQRRAIFKLDAWASRDLELFRRAFPATPWLFVYRDPAAIVASQQRLPGMPSLPGMLEPELFGLDLTAALALPREEYCAIVIATICADALRHLDDAGCLVGYEELPQAVWTKILPHFGISERPGTRELMRAAAQRDAKRPYQVFDRAASAPEPSASVRRACRRHAEAPYIRLRAQRDARDRARRVPC
jgi:hypothetical protein